jgi:hypothetical protein
MIILAWVMLVGFVGVFIWAAITDKSCPYKYQMDICGTCELGKKTDYRYCNDYTYAGRGRKE